MTHYDGMDHHDWKRLLNEILKQARDDYRKLMHAAQRKKPQEREAFRSAVELFFDEEYRFPEVFAKALGYDEPLSLQDFLEEITEVRYQNLEAIQAFVIGAAKNHWEQKPMHTINIPEDICVEGHFYDIENRSGEYEVDYERRVIYLDKEDENVEETLVQVMTEVICFHRDIRTSKTARIEIAQGLYHALKVNDSLRPDE